MLRFNAALLVLLVLLGGCARSPEARKARHLERGDGYFKAEKYREAILEYRNALRIEGTHGHATRQLGFAHYELGELGQAYRYLLKARDLRSAPIWNGPQPNCRTASARSESRANAMSSPNARPVDPSATHNRMRSIHKVML
jgi:tetratricopeptide (TPR) repeat protein